MITVGTRVSFQDEHGNDTSGIVVGFQNHDNGSCEFEVRTTGEGKKIFYRTQDKLKHDSRQASQTSSELSLPLIQSASPFDRLYEAMALSRDEAFRLDVRNLLSKYHS